MPTRLAAATRWRGSRVASTALRAVRTGDASARVSVERATLGLPPPVPARSRCRRARDQRHGPVGSAARSGDVLAGPDPAARVRRSATGRAGGVGGRAGAGRLRRPRPHRPVGDAGSVPGRSRRRRGGVGLDDQVRRTAPLRRAGSSGRCRVARLAPEEAAGRRRPRRAGLRGRVASGRARAASASGVGAPVRAAGARRQPPGRVSAGDGRRARRADRRTARVLDDRRRPTRRSGRGGRRPVRPPGAAPRRRRLRRSGSRLRPAPAVRSGRGAARARSAGAPSAPGTGSAPRTTTVPRSIARSSPSSSSAVLVGPVATP